MSPSESYIIRECMLWPMSKKGTQELETRNVECVQGVGVWEAQLGKGKESRECEPVFRTEGGGTGIRRRMVGRCVTLGITNETDQAEHVEPE